MAETDKGLNKGRNKQ